VLTNYSGWAYTDAATKLGTHSSLLFSRRGRADPVGAAQGLRWSDGAVDGMIFDHSACHFDIATLACAKGKPGCLDPIKVQAIIRAYRGPVNAAGQPTAGS
jgi:feruloyl esterase